MALVLLPCDLPTWPTVQRHLTTLRTAETVDEVIDGMHKIHSLCNVGLDPDESETVELEVFDGLRTFLDEELGAEDKERFFRNALPSILNYALKLKMHKPPFGLHYSLQQQNDRVELERRFVASLLAHGFFSTFPRRTRKTHPTLQDFNLITLFQCIQESQAHKAKVLALLHYFEMLDKAEAKGTLVFRRQVMPGKQWLTIEDWLECNRPLCPVWVRHEGQLEHSEASTLRVCFSSSHLGGNVLRKGTSQECLQMASSPELLATIPFVEALEDNEAFSVQGVKPVGVVNKGHGRPSFVPSSDHSDVSVIFMDAEDYSDFPLRQYEEDNILRELNKAFLGFQQQTERTRRLSPIGESSSSTPPEVGLSNILSSQHQRKVDAPPRTEGTKLPDSDSGVARDLSDPDSSDSAFITTAERLEASPPLLPPPPNFLGPMQTLRKPPLADISQGSERSSVFRTAEEETPADEDKFCSPPRSPLVSRSKVSSTSTTKVPLLSVTRESDGSETEEKKKTEDKHPPVQMTLLLGGGRRGPLTLPIPKSAPHLGDQRATSIYISCQSESEEEFASAEGSPAEGDVEDRAYDDDMETKERRQSFAAQLRDALQQEQQQQQLQYLRRRPLRGFSSCSSGDGDGESSSSYAVDISISGPDVGEDDEIRMRRGGSRGFLLAEDTRQLDDEDFNDEDDYDYDGLDRERRWIGRFRRQRLSRKETGDSSKYSFSSDFSSEVDDLYEQFGHWLEDPEKGELDSRDVAVFRFAHSLLKRTLSDSFTSVALGIEQLSEEPRMRNIKLSGTAEPPSEFKNKVSCRSLSLTERVSEERLAIQAAKRLLFHTVESKSTVANADHSPEGLQVIRHLTSKLASLLQSECLDVSSSRDGCRAVSTGNWGCGTKRGDPQLKAMIQWLAASRCGCPCLVYYTCSHPRVLKLDTLCRLLVDRQWTVGELACAVLRNAQRHLETSRIGGKLRQAIVPQDAPSDTPEEPESSPYEGSLFEELMGLDKPVVTLETDL